MTDNFYTMAVVTAKDGRAADLKSVLTTLAKETRKEPGAIEYVFIQDQNDPDTFITFEKWSSAEKEREHWETPHLKHAVTQLDDILAKDPIIHKGTPST